MANLAISAGISAQSLVSNTLVGDCFQVSNITSSGNSDSRGRFTNGSSNIGLSSGIVLCTGAVQDLSGPNLRSNAGLGFQNNSPNDPNLAQLVSGDQYDVSTIEFDFTPTANTVMFDFVFGSEEYCEYVGSEYNDVFGFFISGPGISGTQNLAVLPSSNLPVATNNVNYVTNSSLYINNNIDFPCSFTTSRFI